MLKTGRRACLVPMWENSFTFLVDKIKLCSILLVPAFLSAPQLQNLVVSCIIPCWTPCWRSGIPVRVKREAFCTLPGSGPSLRTPSFLCWPSHICCFLDWVFWSGGHQVSPVPEYSFCWINGHALLLPFSALTSTNLQPRLSRSCSVAAAW